VTPYLNHFRGPVPHGRLLSPHMLGRSPHPFQPQPTFIAFFFPCTVGLFCGGNFPLRSAPPIETFSGGLAPPTRPCFHWRLPEEISPFPEQVSHACGFDTAAIVSENCFLVQHAVRFFFSPFPSCVTPIPPISRSVEALQSHSFSP